MIREDIKEIIAKALADLQKTGALTSGDLPEIKIEHPEDLRLGDYATNIALILTKKEGKKASEIAEVIASKIKAQNAKSIEKLEAVKGFINFFISKNYLLRELETITEEKERYGAEKETKKRIVVEYSSPNIAKSFGIGHLRSTVIGQAIYNLYQFLGWKCFGINHLGDWGTPHGKILYQIKEKKLKGKNEKEKEEILKNLTIEELERLYVDFHKDLAANPKLQDRAREWFKKLEQGDREAKEIWEYTKTISLREFERLYDLLDVRIDSVWGESFYENMLKDVVEETKKKGIAKESQGALIIEYSENPDTGKLPPAMLVKSDGATTYFTRDLAAVRYRIREFKPDILVYETGVEQTLHFRQVFEAARMLGWVSGEKFVHVGHGLYRFEHGKFSTRSGETIHLEEVLREAILRARKIIDASETGRGLSEEEKEDVARAVGIGGVKYNDLSHNPSSDIIFDWDKILNLKGNSAPYIQYTYARCASVLKKAGEKNNGEIKYKDFSLEELLILRLIVRFPEVAREAAETFSPNLLCNFVFDLAQAYNLFYASHRIGDAENNEAKKFRLLLTQGVAHVIKNCLGLLSIKTPERL
ncbi:MAG: arginine--tRNA ligase [Candidatus Spechtbacteria bacterium]|nr:arginine--tRNA ligase [Candidatus Spechtbacteria bacterium]